MVTGFNDYINERSGAVSGAITMHRRPVDKLFEPDFVKTIPNIIRVGRGSTVPMHWNNSPALSGGNNSSGTLNNIAGINFGANPRIKQKNNVLTYKDFIDKSNNFSNR